MLALHAGSRGFDPIGGTCPNDFFRSNRPGYPHPVSSELENSGIRVAVGDCSVAERRRWPQLYQTGKTLQTLQAQRRRTHGTGNGSVPLSHSGNVVTRMGIHTHIHTHTHTHTHTRTQYSFTNCVKMKKRELLKECFCSLFFTRRHML